MLVPKVCVLTDAWGRIGGLVFISRINGNSKISGIPGKGIIYYCSGPRFYMHWRSDRLQLLYTGKSIIPDPPRVENVQRPPAIWADKALVMCSSDRCKSCKVHCDRPVRWKQCDVCILMFVFWLYLGILDILSELYHGAGGTGYCALTQDDSVILCY